MTKPLPYDYSRCYGDKCDKKEQCQRFLTMVIDEPRLLSYTPPMIRYGACDAFIKDK